MTLPPLVGHEAVWDLFRRAVQRHRLASTFLFVGPAGIGKRALAMRLAQALLCEQATPHELHELDELQACGTCPACQQVAALSHPDLILISKPEDKNFIPIELFIGDREHRMREGLCHDISLKPFRGGRKIAIIDDADFLNQEGANCLLKTLEEPPPKSVLILIGTSEQRQLPTIRSRCQVVRFAPLPPAQMAGLLAQHEWAAEQTELESIAIRAGGSFERAAELCEPELRDPRSALLQYLAQPDFDSVALAKLVNSCVEAAGKDAPPRRARLRLLVLEAVDFYRSLVRRAVGASSADDAVSGELLDAALPHWQGRAEVAARCLERCLTALGEIEANANVATLVHTWLDDLAVSAISPRG